MLPPLLADGPSWCPLVIKIPTVKTPELINSLGRVYDFDPYTWKWFAKRYSLDLLDINEPVRKRSWYDGTFVEKEMPDGTVQKIYVPPEGDASGAMGFTVFEAEQNTALSIPLKAEPPRRAEEVLVDVEELAPGVYDLEDEEAVVEDYETSAGDDVVISNEYEEETFIAPPPPAPPEEHSVFFEYSDEDLKTIKDAK